MRERRQEGTVGGERRVVLACLNTQKETLGRGTEDQVTLEYRKNEKVIRRRVTRVMDPSVFVDLKGGGESYGCYCRRLRKGCFPQREREDKPGAVMQGAE